MNSLKFSSLSVEQKIGQLMIARGYIDKNDKDFIYEMIKNKSLGGIQVPYYRGCNEEIKKIKELAKYPIIVCENMSKGFPGHYHQIPSALSLAATQNIDLADTFSHIVGKEASDNGYNMIFGPCVDIISGNSLDKITSALGSDAETVSKLATTMVKGYHECGITAVEKYWPGGRDVKGDSHMMVDTSYITEEELLKADILPYLDAIQKEGLRAIVTKHVIYKNIDPDYPASLSPKMISILRDKGFDGLVIADSFAKTGILRKYEEEKCYGLAIKAGNDMILPNYRVSFKESYEKLLNAYKKGVFTESRLDEAVKRVIKCQEFNIDSPKYKDIDSEEMNSCVFQITRDGLCAATSENVPVRLEKDKKRLFVVQSENLYDIEYSMREISDSCRIDQDSVEAVKYSIIKRFPDNVVVINQFPSFSQIENVCYKSTLVDEVVYLTFTEAGSYKGSETLNEKILNLMEATKEKIAAVIHLGNPYALEKIPPVPRIIFSFGGGVASVEYAIAMLKGSIEPEGKMPIDIDLKNILK